MYVPRWLAPVLRQALSQFPSVLVIGPRQSGKTTFLLEEFSAGAKYLSLDDPLERVLLDEIEEGEMFRPFRSPRDG